MGQSGNLCGGRRFGYLPKRKCNCSAKACIEMEAKRERGTERAIARQAPHHTRVVIDALWVQRSLCSCDSVGKCQLGHNSLHSADLINLPMTGDIKCETAKSNNQTNNNKSNKIKMPHNGAHRKVIKCRYKSQKSEKKEAKNFGSTSTKL